MRVSRRACMNTIAALGFAIMALPSYAANFVEGKDYIKLPVAQPTAVKDKVEVIEFFWYGCPHCYRLQKPWEQWLGQNGKSIEYKPQPAVLGKSWEIMARAYHAMVTAGGFDRDLHHKIFTALHEKNMALQTLTDDEPKLLYSFIEKEKGAAYLQKFKQDYAGFSMGARIAKDRDMQKTYQLEGTPTIVVGGKYSVNPGNAGGEEAMVPVVDFLVKKVADELKAVKK
jgi:thiol:disulfide interchange protein DsbA